MITTDRLRGLIATENMASPVGPVVTHAVTFWQKSDPFPIAVVGSALIVIIGGVACINWLTVEEELRRQGFGTEIVDWAFRTFGTVGGCWCSETGQAFAKAYCAARGDQPLWKIGEYTPEQMGLAL